MSNKVDLSSKLTVFVITVGNINYSDCMAALKRQTVNFKLHVIKNVHPMDKAFQMMINKCKTEYFIQIDEDMVMRNIAIETMYKSIDAGGDAFVSHPLWDPHLQMVISGVKIYRTSIFKRFAYDSKAFSCEKEQLDRVNWSDEPGTNCKCIPLSKELVIGNHSPKWTPYSIYQRYRNLTEKRRVLPWIAWVDELLPKFKERYLKDPTELNFYALAGVIAGLSTDRETFQGERDSRIYGRKEFKLLKDANDGTWKRKFATLEEQNPYDTKHVWQPPQEGI